MSSEPQLGLVPMLILGAVFLLFGIEAMAQIAANMIAVHVVAAVFAIAIPAGLAVWAARAYMAAA